MKRKLLILFIPFLLICFSSCSRKEYNLQIVGISKGLTNNDYTFSIRNLEDADIKNAKITINGKYKGEIPLIKKHDSVFIMTTFYYDSNGIPINCYKEKFSKILIETLTGYYEQYF